MNTRNWLSGKRATVIKCNAPQEDVDQIQRDLALREGRLAGLLDLAKPVLVVTTVFVAGMSATATYANTDLSEAQRIEQVHQEIRAEITPGYDHLQKMAGDANLTIVDKNDPNLYSIIQASDIQILPNLTYHQGQSDISLWDRMTADIANIIKSGDEIKRDEATNVLMNDPVTYAVSQGTNEKTPLGKLCFLQYGIDDYVVVDDNLKFSFKDIEIKLSTAIHELAHCQDKTIAEYANAYLKRETLADAASNLLIASHTGNWDHSKHSTGALRIIHQHDPDHASHRFIDQLRQDVNLDELQPLTQREAFEIAKQKLMYMDFDKIFDQTQKDVLINKDYFHYVNNDLKWDKLPWGGADDYFHYGIKNESEFNAALEAYGHKKLETYFNHINYKSLEDDRVMVKGALDYMGKHADAFGDQAMKNLIAEQIDHFNEHGSIDLAKIAGTLGYELDNDARNRFFDNMKTIRPVFLSYQPQTRPQVNLPDVSAPQDVSSLLQVHHDAHSHFMRKVELGGDLDPDHDHDHDHDHKHAHHSDLSP